MTSESTNELNDITMEPGALPLVIFLRNEYLHSFMLLFGMRARWALPGGGGNFWSSMFCVHVFTVVLVQIIDSVITNDSVSAKKVPIRNKMIDSLDGNIHSTGPDHIYIYFLLFR